VSRSWVCTIKRPGSSRSAATTQNCRRLRSVLEIQPQFRPALRRFFDDDLPTLHCRLGMSILSPETFDGSIVLDAIRMIVITIRELPTSKAIAFWRPSTETTIAVRFGSTEITLSSGKALSSFVPTNTTRLFVMVRHPVSSFAHCCVLNDRPLVPPK